jgi:hypothetical protein
MKRDFWGRDMRFEEDLPPVMKRARWFVITMMLLAALAGEPLVMLAGTAVISATYWAMWISARQRRKAVKM